MWTQLPPEKGHTQPTQFFADVYCGQMAGWMKMSLGMEVDLGPGHIVVVAEMGNRLATTDMGAVPLFGGAGSTSNTMSRRPRPTSVLSGILIYAAVWPQ